MKKILLLILLTAPFAYPQWVWEKFGRPYGGSAGKIYAKGDTILAGINDKIYFSIDRGNGWHKSL